CLACVLLSLCFLHAADVIRDATVTGVQPCALPISSSEEWTGFIDQGYTLIDEPRPLFTACTVCRVAVFIGGRPLPRHFEFSRKRSEERRLGREQLRR